MNLKKAVPWALLFVAVASGAAYLSGVHVGRSDEKQKAFHLEQLARADSIRIAHLVTDSIERELREVTRRQDSAAPAQRTKRAAFTVVTDTQIVVIGDTTTYRIPAPLISFVRGVDAKQSVDSAWVASIRADTTAIVHERDLWKRRALADEEEMKKERPRFGVKTGIAIGVGTTLLIAKAVAALVR